MNIQWKRLLSCLAVPLAVGALAAFLTKDAMVQFALVNKPPLSPPGWLFPVVWTILYLLMGLASWLVAAADAPAVQKRRALAVYGVQLALNYYWPILFFTMANFRLAFWWLAALWAVVFVCAALFYRLRPAAGWLLAPYILWLTFAGWLNYAVWQLSITPAPAL